MGEFNQMQTIKRHMFALRNGIIADTLRKAGAGYKIIFGLNLPQVQEIASTLPSDASLAEELWADCRTRESRLLAPMVYPREEMDESIAQRWISQTTEIEEIDNLCHKLLRHLPFAWDLAVDLTEADDDRQRYCAMRLMWNLVGQRAKEILPLARKEAARECRLTKRVAEGLAEEAEFILG